MKKKNIVISFLALANISVFSQEAKTVNKGMLSVEPHTIVSTYFDFENHTSGKMINDGEFYFYADYNNEGDVSFTQNKTTGYVVFEGKKSNIQKISGNAPSYFYNAIFNNASQFTISNETVYKGLVNFSDGIVYMDHENGGAFVFLKGANHINTADKSHVDGEVEKIGNEQFKYPIGDGRYYRFASISAPALEADSFTGEYFLINSNTQYPHKNKEGSIELIDNKEYWIIKKDHPTDSQVLVTLSWDERTTPTELLGNKTELLRVVRWDEAQKLWIDEGGVVDFASKTVTTPVKMENYGVFTLGRIKKDWIEEGDVVIHNVVTDNNDGNNDYFYIKNIQRYPENTVRIFNRWGREIYHTENYDSNGNVFRGYAEGKGVINPGEKVPTGTYYYIVEYTIKTNDVSKYIKKAGYLHFEANK